jgi:8-oxo-dGTP pyrophosphatase MutT (NUDIX family)
LAQRLRIDFARGHARPIDFSADYNDPRIEADLALAPAAVLVAITDRPEPGLILTQRSMRLRKHAGQIAFPGGRVDETDADEIAAALREAHEEIGLDPALVDVIGISDRYHTFTGFDIVPVLAVIPPDLPLVPHAHEVEDWFELPLAYALDPAHRIRREMEWLGQMRHFYEIEWQDRRIWGVTATILAKLAKRLGHDPA